MSTKTVNKLMGEIFNLNVIKKEAL